MKETKLNNAQEKKDETFGNLMILIPFICIIMILGWIQHMDSSQYPRSKLEGICWLTVIITAVCASIEISRLESARKTNLNNTDRIKLRPITWFFFISLIWIIGYPAYLYHRGKYGLKNRLGAGITVTILFALISFLYYFHL